MKSFRAASAALIVLGVAMAGPATAMPQASAPAASGDLVVRVQVDCHASMRLHYLPRYDRRIWHRHRQSDCRVIVVEPPEDDYDRPRDCHRDVRRHYLPQYGGEITHKHVGDSCRIRTYSRYPGDDRPSGGTCIRLGIITYCEN